MILWQIALVVTLVVALVVAGLLYWLHDRARAIDRLVGAIWQAGQRVAGNTVHIPQLYGIADGVEAILAKAGQIAGHAAADRGARGELSRLPAVHLAEVRRRRR